MDDKNNKDKTTGELEEVCPECEGTGVIFTDEDDGEGRAMKGTGAKRCLCQIVGEPRNEK